MRVCVFGGALCGRRAEYLTAARELGVGLAERGMSMVYGGARIGLMGAVADAALTAGVEVIGVIPQEILDRETPHDGVSQLEVVDGLANRKIRMAELADGFVALPGGTGTVNELTEVWATAKLALHRKPFGLLNVAGYYDSLLTFMAHASGEQFILPGHNELLIVADDARSVLDALCGPAPTLKVRRAPTFGRGGVHV